MCCRVLPTLGSGKGLQLSLYTLILEVISISVICCLVGSSPVADPSVCLDAPHCSAHPRSPSGFFHIHTLWGTLGRAVWGESCGADDRAYLLHVLMPSTWRKLSTFLYDWKWRCGLMTRRLEQRDVLIITCFNHIIAISYSLVPSVFCWNILKVVIIHPLSPTPHTADIVLNFIVVFPGPNSHMVGLRKKWLRKVRWMEGLSH